MYDKLLMMYNMYVIDMINKELMKAYMIIAINYNINVIIYIIVVL